MSPNRRQSPTKTRKKLAPTSSRREQQHHGQAGAPQKPEDLRAHDCLNYGHLATGNQWKLTGPDGDHWIPIPWTLCTNNAEILRDAAVSGRGIALLPTFIAGADLQQGTLRTILTSYKAPELSLYAIYPPNRHLAVKVRVFIDFLVERFGQRPYWDLVD